MEVEVKLRIQDIQSYTKLSDILNPSYKTTHQQENFFFDGADGELNSKRIALRLRFYNGNKRCLLTIKGRMVMENGIGRATEEEDDIDPTLGRKALQDPQVLLSSSSSHPLITKLIKDVGGLPHGLTCLGGFHNVRKEYEWEGNLLELDETRYEWGTVYELECETVEPEVVREKLEKLLTQHSVSFKYSTTTKFANFRNKTLE
jgi:uncharacterized protein YjbK